MQKRGKLKAKFIALSGCVRQPGPQQQYQPYRSDPLPPIIGRTCPDFINNLYILPLFS